MQISANATSFPRPRQLPAFGVDPSFDLARDAVELGSDAAGYLPDLVEENIVLPIVSTATWGDDEQWPIDDWYASDSDYSPSYRMQRDGMFAALAGAREVAKTTEAVAVVQDPTDGVRYLVPLGVWNPVDESELGFEHAGGIPHWNGAKDHVLLGRNANDEVDVEAVVFDGGAQWINLTGHPVRLPGAG